MRKEEQIKHILSECNFKRINSVMTHLNWQWSYEGGDKKVPSIDDLRSIAEHCLNQVADSTESSDVVSTGGFEAVKIDGVLELRFVLDKVNPLSKLLNTNTGHEVARKS